METSLSSKDLSTSSQSVNNGLDPIGMELISAEIPQTLDSSSEIVESGISDKDKEEEKEQEQENIITHDEASLDIKSADNDNSNEENVIIITKMSREMRNLQKSTKDSKVLSNYLNDFFSPRSRNRKSTKDFNSLANESDTIIENNISSEITHSGTDDKEVPLKAGSPEIDSDSTTVVREEHSGRKRRRSLSRSARRSKSAGARSRPKSLSRMLSDEMAATSDKDDNREDDDLEDVTNVSLLATKPIENRASNPPPKPGWDSYCFKCHLDNAVLSLACKKCKCSFHRHCARLLLTPIPKNNDDFICADCIEINKIEQGSVNKYNHPKIDVHILKEMLTTILEKIRTYPDREIYENDIQFKFNKECNQPLIITQMSLKRIEERIINNFYKVSEAFLHDIKQLEHNWTIIDKNKTKSLKNILKFVVTEINEMEACVHCYSNSYVISNWFTTPCKRPHLLIWAKLKGYPYWPAKVMSIDNQKFYADVRFFGAHDRAWVQTAHCLIFSEKDPNKVGRTPTANSNKGTTKTQKGIADAMKEKDEYIQNIREKYGFRYATTRETLDPNIFQKQLEAQLPNIRKENNDMSDKVESDHNQKEKLTLKIVKASDGTKTIEQKTPKANQEKDRHILYRVLSRNEEGNETSDQSRVKNMTIILKRNTQSETEKDRPKKSFADDSETTESNSNSNEGKKITERRRSTKDGSRSSKKTQRSISNSRSVSPEPSKKKQKTIEANFDENDLLEELPEKPEKISRNSTIEKEISATCVSIKTPPRGTHEIHSLRESPKASHSRSKHRSQSFNRSKSIDKDLNLSENLIRRLSGSSTSKRELSSIHKNIDGSSIKSKSRRSGSQSRSGTNTPQRKRSNSIQLPQVHPEFDPNIIIKDEPITDEEIVQREQVTINDIPDLVGERGGKRKTILISTSDNSNDSFPQNSRARKSFPNSLPMTRLADALQSSQNRNTSAMVCIPQVFPCNPKSPALLNNETQNSHIPSTINGNQEDLIQQAKTTIARTTLPSSNSVQISSAEMVQNDRITSDLPQLVPKPTGVFTCDGSNFQRDSGAVSALFSENAHRMTDYFKSLLIDTIGAISSGVPDAQNVLLKLELEKAKQHLSNLKAEHQMKMEKLKKDHIEDIKALKLSYDEKIKNILKTNDQEKLKLITEIRQQCENEKQRAIENTKREIKRVTWCSNCPKEARFYCCWNTSYCGPLCQKNHWQNHQKFCTNRNSSTDSNAQNSSNNSKQHNSAEIIQVSMASPTTAQQSAIPVTISIPSSRHYLKTYTIQKQASPQSTNQNLTQNILAPNITHSIQAGQKMMIHPAPRPTYFTTIQQHKIPPNASPSTIKTISSTLATEQSLKTAAGLSSNLLVQTISRNNSPPLSVISTINKTGSHSNEIISSPTNSSITTASILNPAIINSSLTLISNNNGSTISHLSSSSPKI